MCKFQRVSCHRNETARSNVLPTVNKYFNCIMCMYKGVALAPSVSVCLCCCIWMTEAKTGRYVCLTPGAMQTVLFNFLSFSFFYSFNRSSVYTSAEVVIVFYLFCLLSSWDAIYLKVEWSSGFLSFVYGLVVQNIGLYVRSFICSYIKNAICEL